MSSALMLDFLSELREHNSLDWMHAHEQQKRVAQNAFVELVQGCIDELAVEEPALAALDPKSLVFRINRDTRFSDEKSPYNPAFRAHISPAGSLPVPVGYYLHVAPGGSFDADSPAAAYLKCKSWAVEEHLQDDAIGCDTLVESFRAMRVFNQWMNAALEGFEMPRR